MALPVVLEGRSEGLRTHYLRWDEARDDAILPRRDHIPLKSILPLLTDLVILQPTPDDVLTRFMGVHLAERLGEDRTGRSHLEMFVEPLRPTMHQLFLALALHPCALFAEYDVVLPTARRLHQEALLIPVTAADWPTPLLMIAVAELSTGLSWNEGKDILIDIDFRLLQPIDIGAGVISL